mgnify:CR=1 FL=1
MTNDKLTQSQIILKVLESSSEPVPSHEIQKTQTPWGWLGTSADREARRLAEEALEIAEVVISKQHDYGHDNILSFREKGLVVRLWDKVSRLKNLLWVNDSEPENESVVDTFTDIAGYSIIALMLHKDTFKNELERDKKNG